MSGSLAAPHAAQVSASGCPQPPQNLRPALFSVPHAGQVITRLRTLLPPGAGVNAAVITD
jgi:hypothetical protein